MTDVERHTATDGALTPPPASWEYAPAPESRSIVTIQPRYGLHIGGAWVEPAAGDRYPDGDDPATTVSPYPRR